MGELRPAVRRALEHFMEKPSSEPGLPAPRILRDAGFVSQVGRWRYRGRVQDLYELNDDGRRAYWEDKDRSP